MDLDSLEEYGSVRKPEPGLNHLKLGETESWSGQGWGGEGGWV